MLKARTGGYWPVRAVDRYEGLSGDFPAAQHVPQRTQEQQPAAQGKAPADPQGGQKGGGKQGRDLRRLPPVPRRPAVRSVRSTGTAGHRPPCSAGSPPCRNWQHGQPWADSPIHRTERTGRRWPFRRTDRRRFPPPGPPPRSFADPGLGPHQQGHRRKEYQPAAQTHAVIGVHFPEAIRCLSGAPSFSGGTPFFHKKHHGGDQCQPRGEQQKILIHCISPYIFVFFRWEA